MANNNNAWNPYTTNVPSGSLTKVQLSNPRNVAIAWPSLSGNNLQGTSAKPTKYPAIFRKLFG